VDEVGAEIGVDLLPFSVPGVMRVSFGFEVLPNFDPSERLANWFWHVVCLCIWAATSLCKEASGAGTEKRSDAVLEEA
jgi:hypothetical protein